MICQVGFSVRTRPSRGLRFHVWSGDCALISQGKLVFFEWMDKEFKGKVKVGAACRRCLMAQMGQLRKQAGINFFFQKYSDL